MELVLCLGVAGLAGVAVLVLVDWYTRDTAEG